MLPIVRKLFDWYWEKIGGNALWDVTKSVCLWVGKIVIASGITIWAWVQGLPGPVVAIIFLAAFGGVAWIIGGVFWILTKAREWGGRRKQFSDRLVIGCHVTPRANEGSYDFYDIYLPVLNNGATDSFMVQIIEVQPPIPDAASFPWSVRWEGAETEFAEIVHDNQRTLHFCRTDLTGEISDPLTKKWKPARLWIFTPKEDKEVFFSTDGMRRSSDLYNLRIHITLRITVRSTAEKIMWYFAFGFKPGETQPHGIQSQRA